MAKKRSNGEGSVRRTKSGNWQGELMLGYTDEGKRDVVRFSAKARGEVLQKMREYQEMRDSHLQINRNLTFSQWADAWYTDYRTQVQPSTYAGYKYTLQILKGHLGPRKVSDILPLYINRMLDKLVSDGYSLSLIRKCRAMLIQIFDAADNNGLIARNPARKAKSIRDKQGALSKPRYEKDAFSDDEILTLQNELAEDMVGAAILLMLDTGLRVQELLALAPDDIAEDGSVIDVNKAIKTVAGKPTLGPPKSVKSVRKIPVPVSARKYAVYLRLHGGRQLIWSQPGLNPYYGVGTFRHRYYTAIKKVAGVRPLSPHCCRHTYITRLQAMGVPIELIARLAGHSHISITDGYTHTSAETLAQAVTALDKGDAADDWRPPAI